MKADVDAPLAQVEPDREGEAVLQAPKQWKKPVARRSYGDYRDGGACGGLFLLFWFLPEPPGVPSMAGH